jgi:hypothetical protein
LSGLVLSCACPTHVTAAISKSKTLNSINRFIDFYWCSMFSEAGESAKTARLIRRESDDENVLLVGFQFLG